MTFTWQKDKQALDFIQGKRFSVQTLPNNQSQSIGGSELRIDHTTRHDSALYTCEARNEFGIDGTNIQLIVQGEIQFFTLKLI